MAAKGRGKGDLKLVTAEAQAIEQKFRDLYDRANQNTAGAGVAAERLREVLSDNPTARLWERIPGRLKVAEDFALEHSPGPASATPHLSPI